MGFLDRFLKPRVPQPPTQLEYAESFISALRESGDTRSWRYEQERGRLVETELVAGAVPGIINLPNMHREYVDAGPEGRKECMRRQVAGMTQRFVPHSFAEAKAKLMPVIRSTTERGVIKLQGFSSAPGTEMAYRALCESIEIGIAYDGEFNVMRLNDATLKQWGVTLDDALDVAVDNLRLQSSKPWLALQNGVFLSQFGDFYDASRLLLTDVLYRQPIAGAPVVMAPNRAVLLLTGDRNEAGLQTLLEVAEQALAQTRSLPPLMLRWSGTAWEKFVPEVLAEKLHRLRLRELAADYQDQQVALNDLHAREGRDVFVAQHTVVQRKGGEQRSICVWTEGVHSLLPDTDFIALYRPSTKQTAFVPRQDFRQQFMNMVKPTEYLPIRHEVEQFPDAGVFQELLATHGKLPDAD
jgi:uncharacterized protein YtpQ (UPF0354 family)